MLAPITFIPVSFVPAVTPLKRSAAQEKAGKDRRGSRRSSTDVFELGDRRDVPSGDPAMVTSSASVLSALLDLPRGG